MVLPSKVTDEERRAFMIARAAALSIPRQQSDFGFWMLAMSSVALGIVLILDATGVIKLRRDPPDTNDPPPTVIPDEDPVVLPIPPTKSDFQTAVEVIAIVSGVLILLYVVIMAFYKLRATYRNQRDSYHGRFIAANWGILKFPFSLLLIAAIIQISPDFLGSELVSFTLQCVAALILAGMWLKYLTWRATEVGKEKAGKLLGAANERKNKWGYRLGKTFNWHSRLIESNEDILHGFRKGAKEETMLVELSRLEMLHGSTRTPGNILYELEKILRRKNKPGSAKEDWKKLISNTNRWRRTLQSKIAMVEKNDPKQKGKYKLWDHISDDTPPPIEHN